MHYAHRCDAHFLFTLLLHCGRYETSIHRSTKIYYEVPRKEWLKPAHHLPFLTSNRIDHSNHKSPGRDV
jgi:hypothetical protein